MKKVLRSIISIMTVCMMLAGTFVPMVSFAEAPSTYGLTVSANTAFFELTSDSVAVYSTDYKTITPAILSASLTAEGYTVSYADADKADNTTAASITDGYVKLTPVAGGEAVYVPIVSKVPVTQTFEAMYEWNIGKDAAVTYSENIGGLGGKSASDKSATFTAKATDTIAKDQFPRIQMYSKGIPYTSHTYAFNVYADGDAVARINYESGGINDKYFLFSWEADGSYYFGDSSDGASATPVKYGTLERGKWHRIAFVFDPGRNRWLYYVDGQRVSIMGRYFTGATIKSVYFVFGLDSNKTAGGAGVVAYDDMQAYHGAYNDANGRADGIATIEKTASFYYDEESDKAVYDEYTLTTPDSIEAAAIAAGAKTAVLYSDSTLKTEAESISDTDNVLVITSKDGLGYGYYSISKMGDDEVVSFENMGLSENKANVRLVPDEYKIEVFSDNPANAEYDIGSAELIGALSSSTGYTFSYVNANKEEVETAVKPVKTGFVKAVSPSGRTVYIPIVTTGSAISEIPGVSVDPASTASLINGDKGYYTMSQTGGIAGKSAEDTAHTLNFGSTPAAAWSGFLYSTPAETHTIEFNLYTDGDTALNISAAKDSLLKIFTTDTNGEYRVFNSSSSSTPIKTGIMEEGKWHKVAITYDLPRGRHLVYIDGEMVSNNATGIWGASTIKTYLTVNQGSSNGKVAIDDFNMYYGYIKDDSMGVSFDTTENFVVNGNTIGCNATTAENLISLINANADGAKEVRIYTNSNFTEEATTLTADCVAVIVAENNAVNYYNINTQKVSPITFSVDSGYITASAKIAYGKEAKIVIASYSGNKLMACNVNDAKVGLDATAEIAYNEAYTTKAFIWEDGLKPVAFSQYSGS